MVGSGSISNAWGIPKKGNADMSGHFLGTAYTYATVSNVPLWRVNKVWRPLKSQGKQIRYKWVCTISLKKMTW